MKTVKDVMEKIDRLHHASSWVNHVYSGALGELPPKCKEGLQAADELLEEYEELLAGMQIGGNPEDYD